MAPAGRGRLEERAQNPSRPGEEIDMADGADRAEVTAGEWRTGWPVVVAAALGMTMIGVGYAALGTFIAPLEKEFGWARAQTSMSFIVFASVSGIVQPFVGMLLDRWGPRRLAIPGALLTGFVFALFSRLDGSMAQWLAFWLVLGVVSQAVMASTWAVAISSHFQVHRARAFGVTMLGSGLAALGMPLLSNHLIETYGWRVAYLSIGIGWGALVALVAWAMLRDRRSHAPIEAAAEPAAPLTGYSVREGVRSASFIKIFMTILLSNFFYFALSLHLLPMLGWAGMSRTASVWILGSLGPTMIVGTVLYGVIADRLSPRALTAILVVLPVITAVMLLIPTTSVWQRFFAISAFGLSCGAQLPSFTNMSTRYLGLKSYGTLSGLSNIAAMIATGLGPYVAGRLFDASKSYEVVLWAGIPLLLIAGAILMTLDRRPKFDPAMA
jgi:predicted MFS family arabinose efflux permease